MAISILSLPLCGKRDVLRARQRARQVAGIVGLDLMERAGFAAAVFACACRTWRAGGRAAEFRLAGGRLFFLPTNSQWGKPVHWPLPARALPVTREEVPFIARALGEMTPLDVFEEFEQQNREYLQLRQQFQSSASDGRAPAAGISAA
jgi:hypothetical protein